MLSSCLGEENKVVGILSNLIKAGASVPLREGDELIRLPSLRQWFRSSRALVMHLTNGTLQV